MIRWPSVTALLLAALSAPAIGGDEKEEEKDPTPYFFRIALAPAWPLGGGFVRDENESGERIGWAPSFRAEFGWQTDGAAEWQRAYNYPALGVGFYFADYGDELGTPMGAYAFYSWPLLSRDRWSLTTDLAFGIAWNFEPFDPEDNPFNDLLGSSTAAYMDVGLYFRYLLTQKLDLYAGAALSHFSSGQVHKPNQGLNTASPLVSLRYNFGAPRPRITEPLPPFVRRLDKNLAFAFGTKEVFVETSGGELADADRRRRFFITNVNAGLSWHVYRKGKIAGGLDFTYDGAAGAQLDVSEGEIVEEFPPASDQLGLGLYGGYEHTLGPVDILVHVGLYVWNTWDEAKPIAYQRIGLRYFVTQSFFAGVSLRTSDWRSDFAEFNVGYRF